MIVDREQETHVLLQVGSAVDVWAAGCVYYEMGTATVPLRVNDFGLYPSRLLYSENSRSLDYYDCVNRNLSLSFERVTAPYQLRCYI